MKKIIIIITSVFAILIILFIFIAILIPAKPLTLDSCIELGICAQGLQLKDENGNDYVMTKDYCIKNHYTWIEKAAACNVRKISY